MTEENVPTAKAGTGADDYATCYYASHLGGEEQYDWESESWRSFFTTVADRVVAATGATTALDVGCAKGLLVQALAARGVDAHGFDVSDHAITTAHADVRDRLSVRSATEPITGRFDLITCIEVLEHMSAPDAQQAIDRMTAATDRVLFSSSPSDFAEPTHINVHPNSDWAAWFAERGFFRRTDVDLAFLTPWAVLFERQDLGARDVVQRYEALLTPLQTEVVEKRQALLDSFREVSRLSDGEGSVSPAVVKQWEAEVLAARHQLPVSRDHVVGVEAETGRLQRDLAALGRELFVERRRVKNLTKRRDELRERLAQARTRLEASQKRVEALTRRVSRPEPQPRASFTRRVARRVRGALR